MSECPPGQSSPWPGRDAAGGMVQGSHLKFPEMETHPGRGAPPSAAWPCFWPQQSTLVASCPAEAAHGCSAGQRAAGPAGGGGQAEARAFSGWPGQGPFLSMRSYLGQRACKAGRPERPHKAHSARPLFTHLLSPRAHTPATPAQGLSPSFDVQEQKTAIKCCFKEGVLAALHLSGESRA